jgi:putative endonuclease
MDNPRQRTGRSAEDLAAERLVRRGWQILDRNWRIRIGELDLIARENATLVFVEVKSTHSGLRHGPTTPALAVGPDKQRRIRRLATAWLAGHDHPAFEDIRFDVIGIRFGHRGETATFDHFENAF